jgi:hypothetical protein
MDSDTELQFSLDDLGTVLAKERRNATRTRTGRVYQAVAVMLRQVADDAERQRANAKAIIEVLREVADAAERKRDEELKRLGKREPLVELRRQN